MDFGVIIYGAAMLFIGANASAAGIGGPPTSPRSIHLASDCISDCQYRWLRCGNGWCRGPWDPFGGGSAPKIEMHCIALEQSCAAKEPDRPEGPGK